MFEFRHDPSLKPQMKLQQLKRQQERNQADYQRFGSIDNLLRQEATGGEKGVGKPDVDRMLRSELTSSSRRQIKFTVRSVPDYSASLDFSRIIVLGGGVDAAGETKSKRKKRGRKTSTTDF